MSEEIGRYELTFMPKLVVRANNTGDVLGCDLFINDTVINCHDALTGTFHNWNPSEVWEELGETFKKKVVGYLQTILLVEVGDITD